MSIKYEIEAIKVYCEELEKEVNEALIEVDILRSLLLDIRSICFSEYAVNEEVIGLMKEVLVDYLKYNHEDWNTDHTLQEDENDNPIRIKIANKHFAKVIEKSVVIGDFGKGWKLNEEGYRCKVLREEYREIFLLRRKKVTYKAIGDLYQVSHNRARQIFFKYMRMRRVRVLRYLEIRKSRSAQ